MRDGYQTVGDIAYRDDEGYVYICDRKKDMIISRRDEHLPGRDRGGAGGPPRHLRGGGVRHPVARSGARPCTPSSCVREAGVGSRRPTT